MKTISHRHTSGHTLLEHSVLLITLPNSARIYIDTVTAIYAVEQAPTYGVLLNPLWNNLQAGNIEVFSNELTLQRFSD